MGRRAVLPKSLPYLRRLTLPPPSPTHLSLHTQLCTGWAPPQPEPVREGGGAEEELLLVGSAGSAPWPVVPGLSG